MKGTMSELELSLFRQRSQEALKQPKRSYRDGLGGWGTRKAEEQPHAVEKLTKNRHCDDHRLRGSRNAIHLVKLSQSDAGLLYKFRQITSPSDSFCRGKPQNSSSFWPSVALAEKAVGVKNPQFGVPRGIPQRSQMVSMRFLADSSRSVTRRLPARAAHRACPRGNLP
jgi:hypothetical protein